MSVTQLSARDRFVATAAELFATKGFEATSVADIQLACGLTAGSGALYKHFPSKRALLEEVLRRHLAQIAADRDEAVAAMLGGLDPAAGNLEAMLRLGAQLVWQAMDRDRAVIRITMRDLEPYPDLLDELWNGVFAGVYRQASDLIRFVLASGQIDVADPDATAAVLLASLTYFPLLEGLVGRTPGDVDRARYLDAWLDHAMKSLGASKGKAAS